MVNGRHIHPNKLVRTEFEQFAKAFSVSVEDLEFTRYNRPDLIDFVERIGCIPFTPKASFCDAFRVITGAEFVAAAFFAKMKPHQIVFEVSREEITPAGFEDVTATQLLNEPSASNTLKFFVYVIVSDPPSDHGEFSSDSRSVWQYILERFPGAKLHHTFVKNLDVAVWESINAPYSFEARSSLSFAEHIAEDFEVVFSLGPSVPRLALREKIKNRFFQKHRIFEPQW